MRRLALTLLVTLVGLLPAQAHPFLGNSWQVHLEADRLVMRATVTLREVSVIQNWIPSAIQNVPDLDDLMAALKQHGTYVEQQFGVHADGHPLALRVTDFQLVTGSEEEPFHSPRFLDLTHAAYTLEAERPAGREPEEWLFSHRTLQGRNYALGVPWDVTYAFTLRDAMDRDLARGFIRADLPYSHSPPSDRPPNRLAGSPSHLTPDQPPAPESPAPSPGNDVVPGPGPASAETGNDPDNKAPGGSRISIDTLWVSFLRHGIHHVLQGYDHLLFLAALTLAARRLRHLLQIILVFTLAHSITVTLCALDMVRVPASIVEPVISASIIWVALRNVLVPHPEGMSGGQLTLAFTFGLVHGLGFGGAFQEILGDESSESLARIILAFCIGVELGHLVVGLPLYGLVRALQQPTRPLTPVPAPATGEAATPQLPTAVVKWGSVATALAGGYYLWQAIVTFL